MNELRWWQKILAALKKLKKLFYEMFIEKPLTRKEIDEIIKKAMSEEWKKEFMKK